MQFIRTLAENWNRRTESKAAAKRALGIAFFAFIDETRPMAPKAGKHPQAALYRHTWKRAVVLADIARVSNSEAELELLTKFQELAGEKYDAVAPEGPYGKVRLVLSGKARTQLREPELARIAVKAKLATDAPSRKFKGHVYLLKSGVNYKIGRTINMNRRLKEIKLQLPDPAIRVHEIQTNDPTKIEKYWHDRYASKRKGGEWFELSDEDVAEFKGYTRM